MAMEIAQGSSYVMAESTNNIHVHKKPSLIRLMTNNDLMKFSSKSVVDLQCTDLSLNQESFINMLPYMLRG